VRLSGNVDSRRRLAEELAAKGRTFEAIETYRSALTGLYEHDPVLLLGLAGVLYESGDCRGSRETLDRLREHNPDYRSADGHLLYARSLEGEGELGRALHEYEALSRYYPGAEAKVRYGQLLKQNGNADAARTQFREVLDSAELAPRHYRRAQREWLDIAKREL
jgi:hypothetical protein